MKNFNNVLSKIIYLYILNMKSEEYQIFCMIKGSIWLMVNIKR